MHRFILALGTVAGLAGPAAAHPHIFVDAATGFRLDEAGRLTALRISWTYDAFTSLVMFDQLGLDADRDGQLDDADRAAIVAGETEWPEEYNGDVHLDLDGVPVAMGRPENGEAWLEDDRVTVVFDLPLAAPLEAPNGARLRLFDPSYFYAYAMLEAEADGACTARLDRFVADEAAREVQVRLRMLSREETPEQADVGALFADAVHLSCD